MNKQDQMDCAIAALRDTKRVSELAIMILDAVKELPRETAVGLLQQATMQMMFLAKTPDTKHEDFIAVLKQAAEETFREVEAKWGIRPQ